MLKTQPKIWKWFKEWLQDEYLINNAQLFVWIILSNLLLEFFVWLLK